jgi:phosphoribosylformylglycinamidine (FGAM) synthase-like enzyme
VRGLIQAGRDRRHDLSDGGLAVALAEMAMASGIGARSIARCPAGSRRMPFCSARIRRATSPR